MTALMKIHEVFQREAADSPRFQLLRNADDMVINMQLDVYKLGSKAHRVIATHARLAESFFVDLKSYPIPGCGMGQRPCNWRRRVGYPGRTEDAETGRGCHGDQLVH